LAETTATPERIAARIAEQNALLNDPYLNDAQRSELLLSLIRSRVIIAREDNGSYAFGTLRFVGFEVPAEVFLTQRKDLNTTLAERAVLRFTDEVGVEHPAYAAMLAWLHQFGLRPNKLATLHLLRLGQPMPELHAADTAARRMAEHVFGLFTLLPATEQDALKRRIDAHRA
jgi:hypothetical protein